MNSLINKAFMGLMSVLMTLVVIGLCFMLNWIRETDVKIALMNQRLTSIQENTDMEKAQSSQISKHWKLHNWAKEQITEIRVKDGMGIPTWPSLTPPPND